MGPEKNPMAYKFTETAIPRIAEEQRSLDVAAGILSRLSSSMERYPVQSPVVEPTLLPKLYALGKINIDPLGVAGPNPMRYVNMGTQGDVTIKAFAAPAHDVFRDPASGYQIATRVLLLQPPKDRYHSDEKEEADSLEFFGINQYVLVTPKTNGTSEDDAIVDDETARTRLLETITQSESSDLIVINGEPVTGETNIFAVRHKKHGIVKLYSVAVKKEDEAALRFNVGQEVQRYDDHRVSVQIANQLIVEITHITTDNPGYNEILDEFNSSIDEIETSRLFDGTKKLSPEEIYAVRKALSNGKRPVAILEDILHSNINMHETGPS
jgi:hypothetical protein